MMIHELKTHRGPFEAVWRGDKPFEWRRDDRDPRFEAGDLIYLREYDPLAAAYTGRWVAARATYVLRDRFGVPEGFAVIGLGREMIRDVASEARQ